MSLRCLSALIGVVLISGCSSPQPAAPDTAPVAPPPAQTLADIVAEADDLSVLASLLAGADMTSTLDGYSAFTVFAPSNEAFAVLPAGTVAGWLQPEQRDELATLLSHHLVAGRIASTDLRSGQILRTVSGRDLAVRIANGRIHIGEATLIATNVEASNGVVHVTDSVLAP